MFKLGPYSWYVDESAEVSGARVAELTGELLVTLRAQLLQADFSAAQKAGLLYDWTEPSDEGAGGVELRFGALGVLHDPTAPRGLFTIKDGEEPHIHKYCDVQGIDNSLRFNGTVEFSGDEVRFTGSMYASYKKQPRFELMATVPVDADSLVLEHYRYTSLEEVADAPPERVRKLDTERVDIPELPDWVRQFTGLEYLRLAYRHLNSYGNLRALPDWIGELRELRGLLVQGCKLRHLPESVGALENLENVAISACQLTDTPAGLWRLPKLKYLTLSQNQLTALPKDIDLPALETLQLAHNKLQTLPAALLQGCPQLVRLNLNNNPLETLPAGIERIEHLEMDLAIRQRLAPKPVASGGGDYDPARYGVDDPARDAMLERLLSDSEADPAIQTFVRLTAQAAVGFHQAGTPTDYSSLGVHRFGGLPDLPTGEAYPRFKASWTQEEQPTGGYAYEFIAQLDCAALAPLQQYLPRTGYLYFFLSTFHDLYNKAEGYRPGIVLYRDVELTELRSGTRFELTDEDFFEAYSSTGEGYAYTGYDAEAEATLGLPPFYPLSLNTYLFREALQAAGLTDDNLDDDALDDMDIHLEDVGSSFDHLIGDYGFSQHELPQTEAALAQGGDPADYLVLLTVKSRGDMQWSDAGDLYYVIHKGDLARSDFSQVFVCMYSS